MKDDCYHNNLYVLPIDKQQKYTLEDRLNYLNKIKKRIKNNYIFNIIEDMPLTTDTIKRGYPPTFNEIETIKYLNNVEETLLKEDENIKPLNDKSNYYILENGDIFKIDNNIIYLLSLKKMKWFYDKKTEELVKKRIMRFSRLINFRDYYDIIIDDKEKYL